MDRSSPSQPDALRVWFRLIRLESRMRVAIAERLRAVDLSVPQCDVLTTLTEREGLSQQELAERLYVTKGNISGLIDRLAAAGLVERRALPHDRRSHAIHLTSAGRSSAERGIAIQIGYVQETFGRMAADDLAMFENGLVKARELTRLAGKAIRSGADASERPAPAKRPQPPRKRSISAGKAATSSRT